MPSSSFFSGTNPTPTEYENAVDLVAQATAQATAALASQTAAATSAQSAQGYSVSAGTSADTATTQAASAASSATSASNSATNASSSASSASSSATSASTSASNAATSATNASNSATSAAGSASSASTYATNAASSATAAANSASDAAATLANALVKTNNLADLSNAGTARTNLGVAIGSNVQAWDADLDAIAAISSTSGLLKKTAANTWTLDTTSYHSGTLGLSEGGTGATDAAGARSNLGLGTAATAAATSFLQVANNLSDLTSASSARTALGLGSAALLASSAVLQSANNLSDLGNVVTARSSLGLGSLATLSSINNSNWSGTQLSVANGGTGLTSLTAGYIPYGNGTGAFVSSSGLTFDGANLTTSNADGYNGLRVTNTSGKLRVSGYLNSTFGAYIDGLNAAESAYIPLTLNGSAFILATNGSERMRIASDGSVGIGTSSPSSKLHVAYTSTAPSLTSASGAAFNLFGSSSARLLFGSSPTASYATWLQATTLNSDTLPISLNPLGGNVLIGTGTDVGANIKLQISDGTITQMYGYLSGGISYQGTYTNHSIGFITNNSTKMLLDTSGNLGLGVTPSAWSSSWKALQITSGGMSLWSDGGVRSFYSTNVYYDGSSRRYVKTGAAFEYSQAGGGGHSWSYAASGSAGSAISFTQAMTLDASGNLGIGTTSIIYRLNVASTDRAIRTVTTGATKGLPALDLTDGTVDLVVTPSSTDSVSYIGNYSNHPLVFNTYNTERMRVTSTGNIHTPAGATNMTNGFFYMPAAAGAPSGTPTAISGTVPFYYDTTNNKFYVYNGAWKAVTLA